jgi:lipopolysaccharide/colanic/teichoic acid biosynthesis glycosyltransferase
MALLIRLDSAGPVFFVQWRSGKDNRPFRCYKFRSMRLNDEADTLQARADDTRITRMGRFLRNTSLDELPQFWNVLKGDMSLVGPRPERQFYIDQIAQIDPQFLHLTKVRPGITSWGQVKFGYAENVEQMLLRMKYDLIYLKNRSLALDFKILFYTILIVLKAKGK